MTNVIPLTKPDPFEEHFWKWYPKSRRVRKAQCKLMVDRITSPEGYATRMKMPDGTMENVVHRATPEEIEAGTRTFLDKYRKPNSYEYVDGGRFIPLSTTFLNQGLWEDD